MVYNVHQLTHLTDCVRLNGPLFTYSNYCMEDNIGHLVSLIKGTTDVTTQITTKYLLEKNMLFHLNQYPRASIFYDKIESKLSFATSKKVNGTLVIGREVLELCREDRSFITDILGFPKDKMISEYRAVLLNCCVFYETFSNSVNKRTNDSIIFNIDNQKYAEIKSIFIVDDQLYFLVYEKFANINNTDSKYTKFLNEIRQFEKRIIYPTSIGIKCALVNFDDHISCTPFPNLIERN